MTIILAAMPVSASFAVTTDPMIEGAKLCTRYLPHYEREYAIPTHLLSAIASTESGRYHEGLGMKLPWPWSINAEGKGYFFETKEQAIMAVRRLQGRGIQSIDVGCMQVNLYHHPEAFASLSEAFEPEKNIAYAAGFLRTLYDEGGTWKKAAANYHSRTPALGAEYVGLVYDSWYTIIEKLRAARLQVPNESLVAMNELKKSTRVAASTAVTTTVSPHVIHVASAEPVVITRPKAVEQVAAVAPVPAPYEHARMNSIRISSEADAPPPYNRNNNILVITPPSSTPAVSAGAEIKTADSTPLQTPMPVQTLIANPATGHVSDESSFSNLSPSAGRHSLEPVSDRRTGPNFIFSD